MKDQPNFDDSLPKTFTHSLDSSKHNGYFITARVQMQLIKTSHFERCLYPSREHVLFHLP